MTGVQDMLNKNIFTKSLTFISYYAWQRNTKYVVRVMCVLHTIFFMHRSDCKAAAVISDIWLQVCNRPSNLQLVIRHIIIHVVHCVQVGEQVMHSKKTKKDWRVSFFFLFVCFCFFCSSVSLAVQQCGFVSLEKGAYPVKNVSEWRTWYYIPASYITQF